MNIFELAERAPIELKKWFIDLLASFGVPNWILMIISSVIIIATLIVIFLTLFALMSVFERKILARVQNRYGPNRVGPCGLFQPVADGIKMLTKEDIVPFAAPKLLYTLAPLLVLTGAFIPFVALPFSERLVVANMPLGLYYILAFEAIEVIGILMAGWAPGSKWSLYGGMRLAAQLLSYEIPMGLCALVIIIFAGSLNLNEIVAWQSHDAFGLANPSVLGWAIFRSPATFVAFFLFYVGGLASCKRAPFDLPEAESELVAGYHTEYSGMRFSFFFMAEYAAMYVICALAAILFLGGWHAPLPRPEIPAGVSIIGNWVAAIHGAGNPAAMGLFAKISLLISSFFHSVLSGDGLRIIASQAIGTANLLMKAFFLYFVMIWVRWTLPRIRIDQVMYLCLKVLLPIALVCVIVAVIQVVLL